MPKNDEKDQEGTHSRISYFKIYKCILFTYIKFLSLAKRSRKARSRIRGHNLRAALLCVRARPTLLSPMSNTPRAAGHTKDDRSSGGTSRFPLETVYPYRSGLLQTDGIDRQAAKSEKIDGIVYISRVPLTSNWRSFSLPNR
ncbi:hypothetical protein EVAR_3938_1 [Eumeta japonica]|uniref:Uncharacterized protein n=1 Tax=Eumeta variegata TaxID=151549 RepID=A0A4C1SRL0_EUMVA|nr:hypothetical protein EVAR_3938_1 [Eumeta japonica]